MSAVLHHGAMNAKPQRTLEILMCSTSMARCISTVYFAREDEKVPTVVGEKNMLTVHETEAPQLLIWRQKGAKPRPDTNQINGWKPLTCLLR